MAELMRIVTQSWSPEMQRAVLIEAERRSGEDVKLQMQMVGFAMTVWPKLLEDGGDAAMAAQYDERERQKSYAAQHGPYFKGETEEPAEANEMAGYTIDRRLDGRDDHTGVIKVWGDEKLRDRIIDLLNGIAP